MKNGQRITEGKTLKCHADTVELLLLMTRIPVNRFKFALYTCQLSVEVRVELVDAGVKAGDVVLGGHVLDNETEHVAEFLERRFLDNAFEVMSL
jgi:hypothetical protein